MASLSNVVVQILSVAVSLVGLFFFGDSFSGGYLHPYQARMYVGQRSRAFVSISWEDGTGFFCNPLQCPQKFVVRDA